MSVDNYLEIRASYSAQLSAIRQLGMELIRIGGGLNMKPLQFIFANSGMGLPMEASMGHDSLSVDAGAWPTPSQIMQQLASLHQGKLDLQNAWSALTPAQRDGTKSPDELLR